MSRLEKIGKTLESGFLIWLVATVIILLAVIVVWAICDVFGIHLGDISIKVSAGTIILAVVLYLVFTWLVYGYVAQKVVLR
jgi:hypothetical protein